MAFAKRSSRSSPVMAAIFKISLLMMCIQRFVAGLSVDFDSAVAIKPEIRLAVMVDSWSTPSITRFISKHFNVTQRTLLPDFDVLLDTWTVRPGVAEGPIAIVGMMADDTPTYHAVCGPLNRQDAVDVVPVVAMAQMLNIHYSDTPILSDRTRFPYSFRVLRSLKGGQMVIFHIAAVSGWREIVSIFQEEDIYDSANEVARLQNVTNYPTLAERNAAAWAVDAWHRDVVSIMRLSRIRVVIVHVSQEPGWQFVCFVHRQKLSGIQYFRYETWSSGWTHADYPAALGDCTKDEMYIAAGGNIVSLHTPVAPGTNVLGTPAPLLNGEDQSINPLTCMPNLTVHDFFNNGELLTLGITEGIVQDAGAAQIFLSIVGMMSDAICAALIALHDAIYRKGISVSSIEERQWPAFSALLQSVSQVEMQGAPGHLRFAPNSSDPEYLYFVVGQGAVDGRRNDTFGIVALATFPDGIEGDPLITDHEDSLITWRDGSKGVGPKPHLNYFPDCAEANGVLVWEDCEPCPPGTAFDELLVACRKCAIGQYQNRSGMSYCELAPPGWYIVDAEAPSAIAPCPEGHECPQAGTVYPQPCSPGRYAKERGQDECKLCPEGRYQNAKRASNCTSCETVLTGAVTAAIASTSEAECICPEGMFRPLEADHCEPCKKGMRCPQGSDMRHLTSTGSSLSSSASADSSEGASQRRHPEVEPGYMTLSADPLTVYRCGEDQHCPGGLPGACASLRDPLTVACGDCVDGAYESNEECLDCGNSGALPFICICIAGLVLVVAGTIFINSDMHKVTAASMMAMTAGSLLVTGLQTLGVFSSMDIPWENPVRTMLKLTEIMSLDLDLLKVGCVTGVNPLRTFALRQLFIVLLIPFVWFTVLMKKYSPRWGKPRTDMTVELCNAVGTLYTVFFISIVLSAVDPFICFSHPEDVGESVRSAPSMLCFEGGEHLTMIIIGVATLFLIPLPFWCMCAYAIAMYPRMITMHSSSRFLHATRFLFLRYVPDRYYFQLIALLRSFLLCLVPAVLRDKAATQVLLISTILSIYVVTTDNLRPWRARLCNLLDSGMGVFFGMLLLCGALFLREAPQKGTVAALSAAIFICSVMSATVAISYALFQHFAPSYFQFFICHHKAHAAAQARYLKILLQKKRGKARIFIDSDNLQELDTLFDIVKSRVRHLVVFLTAETLKRPWCMGEIVTALRANLPVTRLQTPSFAPPTDEQCASPERYVDTTGCNLSEYSIQWSDVSAALSAFLSSRVSCIDLTKNLPGTRRFEQIVAEFLKERVSSRLGSVAELKTGCVLVVTDLDSDEANASAGILVDNIAPSVYRCCEQGIDMLCDYEQNVDNAVRAAKTASAVVVILSPGCLQSPLHLHIICSLMRSHTREAIISVHTPGFEFPPPPAIKELCASYPILDEGHNHLAADCMIAFFKRISMLLPTHAAKQTLSIQSEEIFHRIQHCLGNRLSSLSHPDCTLLSSSASGFAPSSDSNLAAWLQTAASHGTTTASMWSKTGQASREPELPSNELKDADDQDFPRITYDEKPAPGFKWMAELV